MTFARAALVARALLIGCLGGVLAAAVFYSPESGPTLGVVSPIVDALVAIGGSIASPPIHHLLALSTYACAALALLIALRAAFMHLRVWRQLRPILALGCVLAAVGSAASGRLGIAVVAGLALAAILTARHDRLSPLGRQTLTVELLLAILLAGAVVRFYSLAEYSPGFGTHATYHLSFAIDLYERVTGSGAPGVGASVSLIDMLWPGYVDLQHGPMAVVNALGFVLFGVGFEHARMTQAVLGVITLLLAFLVGRQLVDERVGLALAFLLAFSPWHIAISRFNDAEHVLAPLQALLAAYFVLRAVRGTGTTRDFVLAGICCGLSWYVYATNQVMMVALLSFVSWWAVSNWNRFKTEWPKLVAFTTCFLAVSLPHLESTVRMGRWMPMRSGYSPGGAGIYSIASLQRFIDNIAGSLRQLFVQVDDQWLSRPFGGGVGVLEAGLFAGGVAWCVLGLIRRESRDRSIFLLLWLAAGFMPALILHHVEFRRLLLAALLTTVLCAILLTATGVLLARFTWIRRFAVVLVPLLLLVYAGCGVNLYFNDIRIPESESSVYYVFVAHEVGDHAGDGPTVIVLPPEGQLDQHYNAVRLGAYEDLRPLIRSGIAVDEIYRFVAAKQLGENLSELRAAGGTIRVVVPGFLDEAGLARIDDLIRHLDPELPSPLDEWQRGDPLLVWEIPAPDDG